MKVKLLKDLGSRAKGSIMTMHPMKARHWYAQGVCVAVSKDEDEYLKTGKIGRVRRVETTMRDRATEEAVVVQLASTSEAESNTTSNTKPTAKVARKGKPTGKRGASTPVSPA